MVEIQTSKVDDCSAFRGLALEMFQVPGTCQAIFTQANPGYPEQKDEQDIEMLTGHYTIPSDNIPAGLQLTNWAAFPVNESMSERMVRCYLPVLICIYLPHR